ncbi:hypothetical protein [Kitasatospora sp. NPDC015120]|uniref:hypothetical protein n=1 Tax=Kitasatospora sp. NPDC015120 TaxID=3364023 RepID=UPI0036F47B68
MPDRLPPAAEADDVQAARLLAEQALNALESGQRALARALGALALLHARLAADPADDAEPRWVPAQVTPHSREPTAEDKILLTLAEAPDAGFRHIDQITEATGTSRKTVENALTRLVKAGRVLRNPATPGEYSVPSAGPAGRAVDPPGIGASRRHDVMTSFVRRRRARRPGQPAGLSRSPGGLSPAAPSRSRAGCRCRVGVRPGLSYVGPDTGPDVAPRPGPDAAPDAGLPPLAPLPRFRRSDAVHQGSGFPTSLS